MIYICPTVKYVLEHFTEHFPQSLRSRGSSHRHLPGKQQQVSSILGIFFIPPAPGSTGSVAAPRTRAPEWLLPGEGWLPSSSPVVSEESPEQGGNLTKVTE